MDNSGGSTQRTYIYNMLRKRSKLSISLKRTKYS